MIKMEYISYETNNKSVVNNQQIDILHDYIEQNVSLDLEETLSEEQKINTHYNQNINLLNRSNSEYQSL